MSSNTKLAEKNGLDLCQGTKYYMSVFKLFSCYLEYMAFHDKFNSIKEVDYYSKIIDKEDYFGALKIFTDLIILFNQKNLS